MDLRYTVPVFHSTKGALIIFSFCLVGFLVIQWYYIQKK